MAALWMCEVAPTEVASTADLNRRAAATQRVPCDGTAATGGPQTPGSRMLRVLVVDDDRDTTNTLARLVGHWGHSARLAYDGPAGLKAAIAQHPDVVLLDVAMPHMNGFEVARQLRLDAPRDACFIIAITGRSDEECRRQCREADIDLVLLKPVESSLMETILQQAQQRVNRMRDEQPHAAAEARRSPSP